MMYFKALVGFLFLSLMMQSFAAARVITITAENKLDFGRLNQTITITANQLTPLGDNVSYRKIHIKDGAGRELICQPVSTDGSSHPNAIIFQADFAPHQVRKFYAYLGKAQFYLPGQYKTYGRFVRERYDDFAWENDRIAHRTYGPALKTANPGSLISSTIDVWAKKKPKLIINDWYLRENYHVDLGDGADLYTSGNTRGMGADGIWKNNKLWIPENFTKSDVLSTGPIRIDFKLAYDPYNVAGKQMGETRHISLDAGQNLNHFQISYSTELPQDAFAAAGIQITNFSTEQIRKGLKPSGNKISIERAPGKLIHEDMNKELGYITTEQPVSEGSLYAAIIIGSDNFVKGTKDKDNILMLARMDGNEKFSYYAGFSWSKSGQFENYEDWKNYINRFARGLQSPIEVSVK